MGKLMDSTWAKWQRSSGDNHYVRLNALKMNEKTKYLFTKDIQADRINFRPNSIKANNISWLFLYDKKK